MPMIRIVLALLSLTSSIAEAAASQAEASEESPAALEERLPFKTLLSRSVAYVKRPAVVEWRKKTLYLQLELGQAIEYNNFSNLGYGLSLRFPSGDLVWKTSFLQVKVGDTGASKQVAKTPFQQEGRPSRFEWQNGVEMPLIEGIGQQLFTWMPPAQFVLSGVVQLNTYIYQGLDGGPMDSVKRLVAAQLSTGETQQLAASAPAAMRIHRSLHSLSGGLQWDHYYATDLSWTARFLYERPAGGTAGGLGGWYSFSLGAGYGF